MLKSIKTIAAAVLLAAMGLCAQAQKKINEGRIIYTYTYAPDSSSANSTIKAIEIPAQTLAALPKTVEVVFKNNLVKSTMNLMAGLPEVTTILDITTGKRLVLMELMGAKIALRMDKPDTSQEIFADFTQMLFFNLDNVKPTAQKKMINDCNTEQYTALCYGKRLEMWVTNDFEFPIPTDLLVEGLAKGAVKNAKLKGFVMSFNGSIQNTKTTFTATVKAENVGNLSMAAPDDYIEYTMEELMEMAQKGGGQ